MDNFNYCPFCGNDVITTPSDIIQKMDGYIVESYGYCYECGTNGPIVTKFRYNHLDVVIDGIIEEVENLAKEKWNKRIKDVN